MRRVAFRAPLAALARAIVYAVVAEGCRESAMPYAAASGRAARKFVLPISPRDGKNARKRLSSQRTVAGAQLLLVLVPYEPLAHQLRTRRAKKASRRDKQ